MPTPAGPIPLTPSTPVNTTTPSVTVNVPNTSGTVTIQLVVTDNLGNVSAPVTATVTIQGNPTAVLKATPAAIGAGKAITLDASSSVPAAGGTILNYAFSLK